MPTSAAAAAFQTNQKNKKTYTSANTYLWGGEWRCTLEQQQHSNRQQVEGGPDTHAMPSLTRAEKEEKKRLLNEKRGKREARRQTKKSSKKLEDNGTNNNKHPHNASGDDHDAINTKQGNSRSEAGALTLDKIPEDSLTSVICFLPARDVGSCIITCKAINTTLREARVQHLLTRLEGFGVFDDAAVKVR